MARLINDSGHPLAGVWIEKIMKGFELMNKSGFTFECESIYHDKIEQVICEHYDLGAAPDFGLQPLMLREGNSEIRFSAENGRILCKLYIHKNPDTGLFTVEVSDVEIIEFSHA